MIDWTAVRLTLALAATTALILLVVGVPLAWWLATTPRRWVGWMEAVVALPLVLPPTVLGFYLLLLLGPRGPVGAPLESLLGLRLVFSFPGMVLASVLYSLPFAVQPFAAGFRGVDRRLVEAAWCLGLSRTATFFRIVVPLCRPALLAGFVLSFSHTVGEFGVILMVGGNIPGKTRTLSVSIYDMVQSMDYVPASMTAGALLAFSFLVLCAMYSLQTLTRASLWPRHST
ncbi:MAG: molybdate ABC transporter permease subunit [Terrimicrobiaceae bacterium]